MAFRPLKIKKDVFNFNFPTGRFHDSYQNISIYSSSPGIHKGINASKSLVQDCSNLVNSLASNNINSRSTLGKIAARFVVKLRKNS